jgi:hypothetical protein
VRLGGGGDMCKNFLVVMLFFLCSSSSPIKFVEAYQKMTHLMAEAYDPLVKVELRLFYREVLLGLRLHRCLVRHLMILMVSTYILWSQLLLLSMRLIQEKRDVGLGFRRCGARVMNINFF